MNLAFFGRDALVASANCKGFAIASIKELSRCTIVSAVLLALKDDHFVETYPEKGTAKELGDAMIAAIDATFKAEGDNDENDMVRKRLVASA